MRTFLGMLTSGLRKRPTPSHTGIDQLRPLLQQGRAFLLRESLKQAAARGTHIQDLIPLAREAGWTNLELEKLTAYCEFYSGQSAQAYLRVMTKGLATMDYPLFMTACVHCYLHDRFGEGYALLKQFNPEQAEEFDPLEFFPYAGYLAFAGGGKIDEAIRYFDQALDHGLISPLLVVNAYLTYFEAAQHTRVDQLRQIVHERYATDPEALFTIACVELARDFYPEGFRLAEARYQMPELSRAINNSLLPKPRWNGGPIAGSKILIHGEQGLGDIVMMSRYFPDLTAMGAKVIVDCRVAAATLLQHNFPECRIIAGDLKTPITEYFDYWTGVMSLPYHFNTTAKTVPSREGYLTAPPEQSAYWNTRVNELVGPAAPRIGIAWSGNPGHRADKRRSISFDHIAPRIRNYPQACFFTLQTSVPDQLYANLINVADELITLADTAALINAMDLIITVDTSIVHLAGALGKPTWLLLPYRYEWRWGLTGEGNNWYDSVRVLRQSQHGDWNSVLDLVFNELLPEHTSPHPSNQRALQ